MGGAGADIFSLEPEPKKKNIWSRSRGKMARLCNTTAYFHTYSHSTEQAKTVGEFNCETEERDQELRKELCNTNRKQKTWKVHEKTSKEINQNGAYSKYSEDERDNKKLWSKS